jgi:signal transduction histidine kinase/HAMP domain-containing protein
MKSRTRYFQQPRFTLQQRLVLILSGIISLILLGQTLVALSGEVANLDRNIATEGTILAQGFANACAELMEGKNPARFDYLIDRVRRTVDLVELSIVDRSNRIIGSSDPARVGRTHAGVPFGIFAHRRPSPGLAGLLSGRAEFTVSAPVLRGTTVLGFVEIRFSSHKISDRASRLIASAAAMALFWLTVGAIVGRVYVRRITRPLADLTRAATAVTEDRLEEAAIEEPRSQDEIALLQKSFIHLLQGLRRERAENARLLAEHAEMNVRLRERVDEVTADLRETTAYLQSVIRCMKEGVITCNQEGRIIQTNLGAYQQLQGLGKPEPGTNIADVVPEGQRVASAVRAAIESGLTSEFELVRECEEGPWRNWDPMDAAAVARRRTILFHVYPLRGMDKTPMGAVVIVMDETEKRRVEERLRRHDRLISLGTIAAGLAHELGNYMHTINGFSALLCRSIPDNDPRRADAQGIYEENARAIALLDRFLQFARPGEVVYHPEAVCGLVREAIEMCGYKLREAGVEVVDELGKSDQEIRCDARLLRQVFVNIVLNAVDAMAESEEKRLTVRFRRLNDEHVQIRFRDTGTGIAPEHLDRLFDPFFTTKVATGTGLGLSLAHQIIDRHEGSITAQSQEGMGAIFTIVLAVAGPKGEEA